MTRWRTGLTPGALDRLVAVAAERRPEIGAARPVLIGEGISTLAYGWPPPGDGWVLRVSRRHPDPWTWRGGRRHEVELLTELRRRGVPVPADPMVIEEVDGLPAAILERRIVGTPLSAGRVRSDPRLVISIAALLDRLHSVDVDALTRPVPRDDPLAEFRAALAAVDLADDRLRGRVEETVAMLESRTANRTLCHRDFRSEHLIIGDDGELAGLLDLGEVGIDDPAVDLAFLHGELGPQAVAGICSAMDTAEPGLSAAARAIHNLWPLLELAPGGESWGDPATARSRLAALV